MSVKNIHMVMDVKRIVVVSVLQRMSRHATKKVASVTMAVLRDLGETHADSHAALGVMETSVT